MNKYEELKELLKPYDEVVVDRYINYCKVSENKLNKNQQLACPWMKKLKPTKLAEMFKQVDGEGLQFDGVHITIQSRGITYDYIAYKNKMLIAYPKTLIDMQMVYSGDEFEFEKLNGKINYSHKLADPFGKKESDIIGGYVIIKNKRGEFITTMSNEDFAKHKKVAKTQYIWNSWFTEMCMKTLIRKAVKVHFEDVFDTMNQVDNVNYDLTKKDKNGNTEIVVNDEDMMNKIKGCQTEIILDKLMETSGNIITKNINLLQAVGMKRKTFDK